LCNVFEVSVADQSGRR